MKMRLRKRWVQHKMMWPVRHNMLASDSAERVRQLIEKIHRFTFMYDRQHTQSLRNVDDIRARWEARALSRSIKTTETTTRSKSL